MRCILSLAVAVTVLGFATQANSEGNGFGLNVRWIDYGAPVDASPCNHPETESSAVIKEGESESPEMIALIEKNREDREHVIVIDRQ
jgi:hypothetical protein